MSNRNYVGWVVRDDAPHAVSLGKIISYEPGGYGSRMQYDTFLPGQEVPYSYVDPVSDRMDASPEGSYGEDHLWAFLEHVGERPQKTVAPPVLPADPSQAEASVWDTADVPSMQTEIGNRRISVTGTGPGGNVQEQDMRNALKADDLARANPFA